MSEVPLSLLGDAQRRPSKVRETEPDAVAGSSGSLGVDRVAGPATSIVHCNAEIVDAGCPWARGRTPPVWRPQGGRACPPMTGRFLLETPAPPRIVLSSGFCFN